MATPVIMPKVDMDQDTGTIVEWLKQDGDFVEKGGAILLIETSKVAIEIESPRAGILRIIQGEPGDVIPIATVIAYVLEPGEELPETAAPAPQASPQVVATRIKATPVAEKVAAAAGIDLDTVRGTGPGGRITKEDVEQALESKLGAVASGKVYATPASRRIAREQEVDLTTVVGSGPGGRIQAADVVAAAAARPTAVPPPEAEAEVIPLQGMRRTIAERMTASYQTAPHITFTARVDMTRFNEARRELNERAEEAGTARVSATAMLVKAVAWALEQHPWMNSTLRDEAIYLLPEINVGVAVALEAGLIVPVVRAADRKGIGEIAAELNDLVARAREGRLLPGDVSGGTFTISNLGPFGIEQFTAIINPPEAAILAVGAIQSEVVPAGDGQFVARPMMRMTLSADHRIVDGVVAARFVADLKAALEKPTLMLW